MPVKIQPKNIHNDSQANPINAAIFSLQTPVLQQPEPQTHNARPWLKLQQILPNRLQQSQPLHGFAAVTLSLAFRQDLVDENFQYGVFELSLSGRQLSNQEG